MAVRSANVNVRVEPDIKEQAEDILGQLGVSVSAFINMTYRQVILKHGIPFSVTMPANIDTEFDAMMETGLRQAKAGDSLPLDEAFREIREQL